MIEIHLTLQEIQDLNEAIDDPSHSEKTKIKLLVIRMRHEGAKTGFISKCLNLHGNTVTNYLNEFQAGKLPATLEDGYYKPTSSLDPFLSCIRCSFRACPVADAKQAVERIHKLTGIRLSESQSRRFMKSLGLKLRKTAPIPGKCDPQLQFDFYTREMLPRLEEARLGERKAVFVDAAHFVPGAFLGLIWCFQRIFLKTSPGRQRYNILGAIDSHHQEFTSIRTTENINALTIVSLLDVVKEKYPLIPISLVMDNARYQHCNAVKAHAAKLDIELLFLPSYSPNLNLIERVWKLTKKKCPTNKYHKDFRDFRNAIDQCLDDFEGRLKPELKSLLALNFQFFQNHNFWCAAAYSSPTFVSEANIPSFRTAMKPPSEPFKPDPSHAEEWDNPAMTEFKRQEAEERVNFAKSHTREEWLASIEDSRMPDVTIRLAPKPRGRFPFKLIRLPW